MFVSATSTRSCITSNHSFSTLLRFRSACTFLACKPFLGLHNAEWTVPTIRVTNMPKTQVLAMAAAAASIAGPYFCSYSTAALAIALSPFGNTFSVMNVTIHDGMGIIGFSE